MENVLFNKDVGETFIENLVANHGGRIHHRAGVRRNVRYYAVAWVESAEATSIKGRITGPTGSNAGFEIFLHPTKNTALLTIVPEAPYENYAKTAAVREVTEAVLNMVEKAKSKPHNGPMNMDQMEGYYLRSTGKNNVGDTGMKTFAMAVAEGYYSEPFVEACVVARITTYCK